MEIHNRLQSTQTQTRYLDSPELFCYPTSASRDDPIHSPALQLLAEACDMPQRFPLSKENASPPLASCSYAPGYSKSPLARLAAMPSKPTPKYHTRLPQVAQLLAESAKSPDEASPLTSDYPRWVVVVAALSLYHHPSYPAHLAFWRPEIMNATADCIDAFLKTREAKYLETLEGWIDAEFALYTLKGYQRGFYPHLYDPVTGGRILRKRKAKDMDPESLQAADEAKPKRRTKRARKAKTPDSSERTTEPIPSTSVDSTPSPLLDVDLDPSSNVPPTIQVSSSESPSPSPDLPTVLTRTTKHRRRSSSMTSSGVSAVTLVNPEGADPEGSRENSPAETAVDSEEVLDTKAFEQVGSQVKGFTKKLDDDTQSVSSSLSPLESTPPPPPRRSARATKKTATQTPKRLPTTSRSRAKRIAA